MNCFITEVNKSLFNFIPIIIIVDGFFRSSGLVCTEGGCFQIMSLMIAGGHGVSVLHRHRWESLFVRGGFWEQAVLSGEYCWQGRNILNSIFSATFTVSYIKATKIFFFQNVPPDLSQCVFVIEQALSVRALQEIISSNDAEAVRRWELNYYCFLLLKCFRAKVLDRVTRLCCMEMPFFCDIVTVTW